MKLLRILVTQLYSNISHTVHKSNSLMNYIVLLNEMYYLIPVTKELLSELPVEKGMDLFEVCNVLRENLTVQGVFFGCTLS